MFGAFDISPLLAPPTVIDRERSRRLGEQVGARQRQCYLNALWALNGVPEAVYAEGYVVVEDALLSHIDHAWLLTPDGVVLDPTPRMCAPDADRATYFPALTWSAEDVDELMRAHRGSLTTPLARYRPDLGQREVGWRDAKLAAARHRSALTLARTGMPDYAGDEGNLVLRAVLGTYWEERRYWSESTG